MAIIEEHDLLPAGALVQVRGAFTRALTLPDKRPLAISQAAGYTAITLPRISGYQLIKLE